MCLAWGLWADMPGATTYGRQTRVNGRIVNQPYNTVAQPYYYGGNLVYAQPRRALQDHTNGRIQYQTNYTQYGYRNPGVNYSLEAQRLQQQSQQQNQYNPQANPYNQPYYAPPSYAPNLEAINLKSGML